MAIKESVTLEEVINYLNELLEVDTEAVSNLFNNVRVPCNEAMANYETVQVEANRLPEVYGEYAVGILGILNGLFGCGEDSWSTIYMTVDNGVITRFCSGGK